MTKHNIDGLDKQEKQLCIDISGLKISRLPKKRGREIGPGREGWLLYKGAVGLELRFTLNTSC